MSDLDYLGVRPCGCITAWLSDDHVTKAEVRSFYRDMADSGREVRRMTLADARAQGDAFMPLDGCPHAAARSSEEPSADGQMSMAPLHESGGTSMGDVKFFPRSAQSPEAGGTSSKGPSPTDHGKREHFKQVCAERDHFRELLTQVLEFTERHVSVNSPWTREVRQALELPAAPSGERMPASAAPSAPRQPAVPDTRKEPS